MALPLAHISALDRSLEHHDRGWRKISAPRPVVLWHLVSLDAPTVAVVWTMAFAWAANIRLASWEPVLLALITWFFYVSDRLLDARVGLRSPALHELRDRHYFHWRHRRLLASMALVAAACAAVIVLEYAPLVVRERGSLLGAAALAYFSGVHGTPKLSRLRRALPRLLSKEFLVAVLFTAGCVLPAWTRIRAAVGPVGWWFVIVGVYFAALAWLNCASIARWERENIEHKTDRPSTEIKWFSRRWCEWVNGMAGPAIAWAGLALAFAVAASHTRTAALLMAGASSAVLLALLDRARLRITPVALRAAADLVLLTPLLLLLR